MVRCSLAEFGCLAEGVLQAGISLQFQAHGSSMTPFVRDGDTLLISPVQVHDLRVGQIVLCQTGNDKFVVHRIVQRRRQQGDLSFLVKGDLCHCPDGWVDGSRILGRAEQLCRRGRTVQLQGAQQRLWSRLVAALSSRNVFNSSLVLWLVRTRGRLRRFRISSSGAA
ncbi:MAG TPA: S24/S26 family peptidase [Anaerolineae bacterium]|nr:S24/S26 family peptidase [Anaerolineae bacterium]